MPRGFPLVKGGEGRLDDASRPASAMVMDRTTLGSVALMVIAMSLIPVGDAAGKILTGGHGVEPGVVACARFAVGAAMIAILVGGRVEVRLYRDPRIWLRAALIAAAIACILTALRTEPLADVFGAFFVGPLVSYALAVLLLRERVAPLQTVALGVGFAGVVLVVRPDAILAGEAGPGILFAAAAGVLYGAFLTASRWVGGAYPPRQLMLSQTGLGTLLLVPIALPGLGTLPPLDGAVAALFLLSGIASASGNLLLVVAYRRTGASVLAPFVYTQLASAMLIGWIVFRDWPGPSALAGMGLLVAAGVGTLAARTR